MLSGSTLVSSAVIVNSNDKVGSIASRFILLDKLQQAAQASQPSRALIKSFDKSLPGSLPARSGFALWMGSSSHLRRGTCRDLGILPGTSTHGSATSGRHDPVILEQCEVEASLAKL